MRKDSVRRCIVTCGNGYQGSRSCKRLLDLGYEALCVDCFCTGSKKNVLNLAFQPGFRLSRHPLYLEVDAVCNLTGPATPIHCQFDPVQTARTSIVTAINMLVWRKREVTWKPKISVASSLPTALTYFKRLLSRTDELLRIDSASLPLETGKALTKWCTYYLTAEAAG